MSIPLDKKVPMLNHFHTYLYQHDWCFTESQEKDRQVLEDFPTVSRASLVLDYIIELMRIFLNKRLKLSLLLMSCYDLFT